MKVLKGSSAPPQVKHINYNPEVLTSQKRQWALYQLPYLDHRSLKEPSRLFESMVIVGLHPNCDIQALQRRYIERNSEGSGRLRRVLSGHHHPHPRVEPSLEPQVLFVYPPEKQLPDKYKDLLSFCFPGGVDRRGATPSMSELNEILLGQHLKKSDQSFVFRLQVADDSTLYRCCVLVDELVQRPSGLISMISARQSRPLLNRYILTTWRCYCILSRLPFFELHFGVLNSIFTEERLERLTKGPSGFSSEDSTPRRVTDGGNDVEPRKWNLIKNLLAVATILSRQWRSVVYQMLFCHFYGFINTKAPILSQVCRVLQLRTEISELL